MQPQYTIVAFSHLRWNFVYQRPQHLLSRLAASHPVFFIEEPEFDHRWPAPLGAQHATPERHSIRPANAGANPGLSRAISCPYWSRSSPNWRAELSRQSVLAWLYTPMALPLAEALAPDAVVYDCMDELSPFLGAPPELLSREAELLKCADVVFTGGPSLYRAKQDRHPNVHCFPSSVDAAHFRLVRRGGPRLSEARGSGGVPHPRLGFFGVIDERLDLALLDAMAAGASRMADRAGRPGREDRSRHACRGGRTSTTSASAVTTSCPRYLAGWDVCLLPFARNDATRFISPTKTLEYMAAELPIVSTPDHRRGRALRRHRLSRRHAGGVHRRLRGGAGRRAPRSGPAGPTDARGCWPARPGT